MTLQTLSLKADALSTRYNDAAAWVQVVRRIARYYLDRAALCDTLGMRGRAAFFRSIATPSGITLCFPTHGGQWYAASATGLGAKGDSPEAALNRLYHKWRGAV